MAGRVPGLLSREEGCVTGPKIASSYRSPSSTPSVSSSALRPRYIIHPQNTDTACCHSVSACDMCARRQTRQRGGYRKQNMLRVVPTALCFRDSAAGGDQAKSGTGQGLAPRHDDLVITSITSLRQPRIAGRLRVTRHGQLSRELRTRTGHRARNHADFPSPTTNSRHNLES